MLRELCRAMLEVEAAQTAHLRDCCTFAAAQLTLRACRYVGALSWREAMLRELCLSMLEMESA